MSSHPIHRLDDDVHQRVRLGILAVLTSVAKADFAHLKSTLQVTDGNLGRHLEVLERSGLITVDKTNENGRLRTWLQVTRKGRTALRRELQALNDLIAEIERNDRAPAPPRARAPRVPVAET
jgi:DNA-binding MarR family transcriptional regulator